MAAAIGGSAILWQQRRCRNNAAASATPQWQHQAWRRAGGSGMAAAININIAGGAAARLVARRSSRLSVASAKAAAYRQRRSGHRSIIVTSRSWRSENGSISKQRILARQRRNIGDAQWRQCRVSSCVVNIAAAKRRVAALGMAIAAASK